MTTGGSPAGGATGGRRAVLRALLAVFAAVAVSPAPAAAQDVRAVFDKMSPSVVVIRGRGRDVGVNGRGLTYITEIGSGVVVSAQGDVLQAMDEITVAVEFAGGATRRTRRIGRCRSPSSSRPRRRSTREILAGRCSTWPDG